MGDVDDSKGFEIIGLLAGDNLGSSVSNAGDINGDGFDDVVIGADGVDSAGLENVGAGYILFGGFDTLSPLQLDPASLDASNGLVITELRPMIDLAMP